MEPTSSFTQRTVWNSTDELVLKGHELQALVDMINVFRPAIVAVDQIIERATITGIAKTEFIGEDGNPIDPALLEKFYESLKQSKLGTADSSKQAIDPQPPAPVTVA